MARQGIAGSTEGGEALTSIDTTGESAAAWHVLWTRSNCEQKVTDHLSATGFHPFLPKVSSWSWRAGRRHLIHTPLFPGYLFLNDALDKASHVELRKSPGLAAVLGDGWDRPARVPAHEVEAIRRVVGSGAEVRPHPYLREGQRVRIVTGPLGGLDALLVRQRPSRGLVVVSVHLLQRSVAVELDISEVVAA
jgi:transcription antitermination factor NusG